MQREVLESYKMFKYFWINKLKVCVRYSRHVVLTSVWFSIGING